MGAGRGRRTGIILIFVIILVVAIGLIAVVALGVLGSPTDVSDLPPTDVPTVTPPPTILVIVAVRDIPRGTRMTEEDVTFIHWPDLQDAPPPVDVLIVEEDGNGEILGLEQVANRIARVDILVNQPILNHMLTPGDEPIDLADAGSDAALLIPKGSVAMTIPITSLSSVGYALRPGDHVDLMMSFAFVDVDEQFQSILPNWVHSTEFTNDEGAIIGTEDETPTLLIEGRQEDGPFGTTDIYVIPSEQQRPRLVTQLVIDNAIVLKMGYFSISDIDQPIVITQALPPTALPDEGEVDEDVEPEATPTPTPLPEVLIPQVVTLILSRQDALVLKYSLEVGADIDLLLRSALDDDLTDIVTDSVTLPYIIDFYNVAEPPRFRIAHEPRLDLLSLNLIDALFGTGDAGEEAAP